eukprot:CAMPEP_0113908514 /NCGR_PEP_ID=MMETSP0780_2-20120614/26209_1 /TAXON_ID=652834 /ORGANISM="Palpitomonas bilix" /LENGTH=475 /DNA_ID=CAMNT_0000903961 /DNA_START=201 /DNA_END=1628 /DNA_ORIENTATION=- /assembly_acc=CAM_ASM_000599
MKKDKGKKMVAPEQHESVKKEDEDESQGAISAPVPVGEEVTIKQEIETCVTVAPRKKEAGPTRSRCSIPLPRRDAGEEATGLHPGTQLSKKRKRNNEQNCCYAPKICVKAARYAQMRSTVPPHNERPRRRGEGDQGATSIPVVEVTRKEVETCILVRTVKKDKGKSTIAPEQHKSVKKEDEDESQGAISAPVGKVTIKQEIETCITVAPLKKEAGPTRPSCSIPVPRRDAGEEKTGLRPGTQLSNKRKRSKVQTCCYAPKICVKAARYARTRPVPFRGQWPSRRANNANITPARPATSTAERSIRPWEYISRVEVGTQRRAVPLHVPSAFNIAEPNPTYSFSLEKLEKVVQQHGDIKRAKQYSSHDINVLLNSLAGLFLVDATNNATTPNVRRDDLLSLIHTRLLAYRSTHGVASDLLSEDWERRIMHLFSITTSNGARCIGRGFSAMYINNRNKMCLQRIQLYVHEEGEEGNDS